MRAAVLVSRGRIEVRDLPGPRPKAGEVLVRVGHASICGSDHHVVRGEFEGRVKYPAVLGHEFWGVVEEAGAGATHPAPGTRVAVDPVQWCGACPACLEGSYSACRSLRLIGIDLPGAFAELVTAPAHSCFELPERFPGELGCLVEPCAIACHAVGRSELRPGDVAVVIGSGRIGLAIIDLLASSYAAEVVAVDVDPAKLALAKRLGAHRVIDSGEADPVREVLDATGGFGADRVFEAVGSWREIPGRLSPMEQAFAMVRGAGRVVVLGQGNEPAPVLWKPFVWREAEARTSRVTRGEFPRAVRLIAQGRMRPGVLVTHEFPLERAAEAFALLDDADAHAVKIRLTVGG